MKLKHGDLICNAKDDSGLWIVAITDEGTKTLCLVGSDNKIREKAGLINKSNPVDRELIKVICNITEIYLGTKGG